MAQADETIFGRQGFESFILSLPAVSLVRQWRDDSVAKVGGRIFALLDKDGGDIWFKVSDMSFDMLTTLDGIRPAPYFARAGWVAVSPSSPLSETDIRAYVTEAHRLVASRLTKKLQSTLKLTALIAAAPHTS